MSIIKGIKVGTTDITSTYSDGNNRSDTKQLEVVAVSFQDVGAAVSSPGDTVYTGSAITPTPEVTAIFSGVITNLELGTDYTLSYSNNIDAGTATLTVTGIGNYSGTISTTWTITGAEFTSVSANDQTYTYDGNPHGEPVSAVSVNGQPVTITYRTTDSGEYNLTTAPQVTNVGSSSVVYFKVSAPNHNDYFGSYRLSIAGGLFVKLLGTWTPVREVYKKISGIWTKQDNPGSTFSTSEKYVKMD